MKSAMVKEYYRTIKSKRCYFKITDNKVFRKYTATAIASFNENKG